MAADLRGLTLMKELRVKSVRRGFRGSTRIKPCLLLKRIPVKAFDADLRGSTRIEQDISLHPWKSALIRVDPRQNHLFGFLFAV